MGKFRQIFTELPARDTTVAGCYSLKFFFFSFNQHAFVLI